MEEPDASPPSFAEASPPWPDRLRPCPPRRPRRRPLPGGRWPPSLGPPLSSDPSLLASVVSSCDFGSAGFRVAERGAVERVRVALERAGVTGASAPSVAGVREARVVVARAGLGAASAVAGTGASGVAGLLRLLPLRARVFLRRGRAGAAGPSDEGPADVTNATSGSSVMQSLLPRARLRPGLRAGAGDICPVLACSEVFRRLRPLPPRSGTPQDPRFLPSEGTSERYVWGGV